MCRKFVGFFGVVASVAIAMTTRPSLAATLVSDTFALTADRPVGSSLDGQNTEVPTTGVMWSAYDDYQGNAFTLAGNAANGYISPPDSLTSPNLGSLERVPASVSLTGALAPGTTGSYAVKANLYEPANGSIGNALGVFLGDPYSVEGRDNNEFLALEVQASGAWSLSERGSTSNPPTVIASGTVSNAGWAASAPTVQLVSNTLSYSSSTATAVIGGVTVASNIPTAEYTPGGLQAFNFSSAGVDQYLDAGTDNAGVIDDFSYDTVGSPEPTSATLLIGPAAAALASRRRRRAV
jgi:hypothetical protein